MRLVGYAEDQPVIDACVGVSWMSDSWCRLLADAVEKRFWGVLRAIL